ncbi:MAG: phosphoglucomutase/phosphomannomutase family protein [Bacteroidia bacterium]|nr:phosphoglucomutase/phosphomannomutase family protein [Bacteroidia bacterium]
MVKIKFGTDGWRAVIAKEFTVDNVARVSLATAAWLLKNYKSPSAVLGHDCRFQGKLFTETVAKVFASKGIKVYLPEGFVSTPAVSLSALKLKADIGVVITASHNPPDYSGYKLKGSHGGPLAEEYLREVEKLIPDIGEIDLDSIKLPDFINKGMVEMVDLEKMYIDHVLANFDIEKIRKSKFRFAFDAMFGSGQNVMRTLFPDIDLLHCEHNPTFKWIPPEPLHKNLQEFSKHIKGAGNIDCGLAIDGDADRIALYDRNGNYMDSHHIILILIHCLSKYKKMTGKVVTGFSSTVKVEKLCRHYGLEVQRVRIGFKDICRIMLKEDVLVGGEESGGIAIKTHIPERDGIWMGLTIWQFMVETGKTLNELISEVYAITGSFAFERSDLKINESLKQAIIAKCEKKEYTGFGKYKVEKYDYFDGYKFFFNENEWVMIRPSGTEPVLRTYAEAATQERAKDILAECYKTIISA